METDQELMSKRQMTAQEKKYFQLAHKRHLGNMTTKQVVQGKVFEGDSFTSRPQKIIFKDFTIGETHTQVIQLTNISYSFNSFKIPELRDVIREYFQLKYVPPGRMSAGTSCSVTIKFTPQFNNDIIDCLKIQTQTGPVQIPLECISKKALVRCKNSVINFDKVIQGQSKEQFLKLTNEGALPTDMIFRDEKGRDLPQEQADFPSDIPVLSEVSFQTRYKINGEQTLNVPFVYKPHKIGAFSVKLQLYFSNFLHSPPILLTLRGQCVEVPIEVERPIYDMETCLLGHIYREKIVFKNKSDTPTKVQITQPKETKNYFQFNPLLGYIQGKSHFEIWLKFSAEKDLMTHCAKFLEADRYRITFKLIGADQKTPVLFDVLFRITSDVLKITPNKLDFGRVFEGTGVKLPITIQNCSQLPQQLLFYPLPKQISLEMDLIPLKILPKEKLQTRLTYRTQKLQGTSSKKEEGLLKCKIITGKIATCDQRIPFSCQILKCDLHISKYKIDFPALQRGQNLNTTIEIKNVSQKSLVFQLFPPQFQISGITLIPVVKTLMPQQVVDIHIIFKSFFKKIGPETMKNLKAKREKEIVQRKKQQKKVEQPAKKQTKKEAKKQAPAKLTKAQQQQLQIQQRKQQELQKQKEQEQRLLREQLKRNFDLKQELRKLGGRLYQFPSPVELPCPSQGQTDVSYGNQYCQIYNWLIPCYFKVVGMPDASKSVTFIQISTVTVQKLLVLNKQKIDFGEVAVGVRKIKQLQITNSSQQKMDLKMQMLPAMSGFSVINALRPLLPGKTASIVVQFFPNLQQPFEQNLKLISQSACVSCQLRGIGVRPQVIVQPENGLLNMGNVVLDDFTEKSFKVRNISSFPVKFQITKKAKGIDNANSCQSFIVSPTEAYVEPGKQIQLKVRFKPDRVSEKYYQLLLIDVPYQKSPKFLYIYGSCYPRQAYVLPQRLIAQVPRADEFHKPEFAFDQLRYKDQQLIYSTLNSRLNLEFTKIKSKGDNPPSCFERKLVVGNCKMLDSKLEKPVNFQLLIQKDDRFACDQTKGTVPPGSQSILTFTFKPPEQDPFIAKIEALSSLGQWKQFRCELKISGGFNKGTVDQITFEIILRGYINEI